MKGTTLTKLHLPLLLSALSAFIFLISPEIFADSGKDIGAIASNVTGTMQNVVKLITAISYVAGMGFALAGIVKFKSHRDNPQQVPLSAPIVLIVVAAALLFLPSVLQTAGATVFGSGAAQAGGAAGFTDTSGK